MINIAKLYVGFSIKHGEEETFKLIRAKSVVSVLYHLYQTFIKEGTIPIESLPKEKKIKYYQIACAYYSSLKERIKASKAMYVLELITSNF